MALVNADRVRDSTITTGAGTVTLSGTAPTGYQNFSVIGNANTTYYCIAGQGTSEWEVGIGTYASSGTTLARTTVLSNSSATQPSAISFSAGTKDVFCTYPSSKGVWLDASGNAIALGTPSALVGTNITGTAAGLTAGNVTTNANLTGPVTSTGNATAIANGAITNAMLANAAVANLSGSNTGDQTITLTGGVTGSGTGSFAATVVTNANLTGQITSVGNAAVLGSFTSAQLLAALTDETGTGANVFANSPTLTTPVVNGFTGDTSVINVGSGQVYKDASGNVGIGTASISGSTKLEVYGNSSAAHVGFRVNNAAVDGYGTVWISNGGSNDGLIRGGASAAAFAAQLAMLTSSTIPITFYTNNTERMRIDSSGRVGIGTTPSYQLQVNTDSAGKPGVGGLWTVVSDERIKANIVPANLDRCYEIVKSVPLKHFGFAPGVYTDDQIQDQHNLGWIAQDVQKVFPKAVSIKPFALKTEIPDGVEEYEEQDFTVSIVEKTETSIQVIDGKPVQVSRVVTTEDKVLLFDAVDVLDEAGALVEEEYEVTPAVPAVGATEVSEAVEAIPAVIGTRTVTYQMPRMTTKTRPKVRHDVIEDCLDLNSGQMSAALYGAVQALIAKVEALEARLS